MSTANPFEVIQPPVDLRSKVKVLTGREAEKFDPVARAEAALTRLAVSFPIWMNDEVEHLSQSMKEAKDANYEGEPLQVFYRAAHNLKGQAATMGFPVVGNTAGLICEIVEAHGNHPIEHTLIINIVNAVRAMVREGAKGLTNEMAAALNSELRTIVAATVQRYEDLDEAEANAKQT